MGLIKKDYIDGVTPTSAQNLNDIQAAIVTLEEQTGREANMALKKVNYIEGETPITAQNLNDIQDAVLGLEEHVVSYKSGMADFGLKGKGRGELVHFDKVHPIEHKVEVGLSRKNLFDMSKIESTAVITNNNDGTITISGTYSARTGKKLSELCPTLKVGDTVVFQIETMGNALIYLSGINYTWNSGGSKTITEADLTSIVVLYGKSDSGTYTISNIQVEIGTTPTAYEPFVEDFSDYKVKVSGKNLVNILAPDYIPSNGYDVLDDNSIRVYTNRGNAVGVKYNVKAPTGAKIIISFNSELGGDATGSYNLVHRNGGTGIIANGAVTTMPENGEMQIEFSRTGGSGNNKLGWIDIKNLQVEIGTVLTEYEPYQETEYTAAADGTVEGVKSISPVMNLSTDKAGAVIDAECFLDPQAVITDLTNTVITLGGEI